MRGRTLLPLFAAALVAVGAGSPVIAGERWLQNDGFSGSASGTAAVSELALGEAYAVRFSAAPDEYPVRLRALRFLFVNNSGTPGTSCGLFWIRVYDDDGAGGPEPGDLLVDSEAAGEVAFEISGNESGLQELDLSAVPGFPLSLDGDFRVELRTASSQCAMTFGNGKFPLLYPDGSGQAGRSFIYGSVTGGTLTWFDITSFGATRGDFVMRALVTTSGVTPPPDVVQPDVVQADVVQADTSRPDVGGADTPAPDSGQPDTGLPPADTGGPQVDTGGPGVDAVVTVDATPGADAAPGGLAVTAIVPGEGSNDRRTDVLILGSGFQLGVVVRLDADALAVLDVGPQRITAQVPAGLPAGAKTLIIENPDGTIATLADAFTVIAAPGTGGDAASGGCTSGGGGSTPTGVGSLVLLLLFVGGYFFFRTTSFASGIVRPRSS